MKTPKYIWADFDPEATPDTRWSFYRTREDQRAIRSDLTPIKLRVSIVDDPEITLPASALSSETQHTLRRIGAEIRARRKKLRLDTETAATRAGISAAKWASIEAAEIDPLITDLNRIAETLGITLSALLKAAS